MPASTVSEFRKMSLADLRRDVSVHRTQIAKLRMAVQVGKEKNTSKYADAKRQLARMLTVLSAKEQEERQTLLQSKSTTSTLSAPAAK